VATCGAGAAAEILMTAAADRIVMPHADVVEMTLDFLVKSPSDCFGRPEEWLPWCRSIHLLEATPELVAIGQHGDDELVSLNTPFLRT
jgi:hypothetical protein